MGLVMRRLPGLVVLTALLLPACGGDDDGAPDETVGVAGSGVTTAEPLDADDLDEFREAALAGTTEGEAYVDCLVREVEEGVAAGEITAGEVRDWSEGKAPVGAVEQFISDPGRVAECIQSSSE